MKFQIIKGLLILLLGNCINCKIQSKVTISARKGPFSSLICTCEELPFQIFAKDDINLLTKWAMEQKDDKFPVYLGTHFYNNFT